MDLWLSFVGLVAWVDSRCFPFAAIPHVYILFVFINSPLCVAGGWVWLLFFVLVAVNSCTLS